MILFPAVRVGDVEIVASGLYLFGAYLPGAVILLAVSTCLDVPPPSLLAVFASEFLDAQRLRLRVAFVTLRIRVLVEPDLGGRIQRFAFSVLMAFLEEQQVRLDSGIRNENAVRPEDEGVQVNKDASR